MLTTRHSIVRRGPIGAPPAGGGDGITWDHDGVNVDSFVLDIDGTEYDLGALSPVTGTTYNTAWPVGVSSGSHAVAVYAVNEDGRHASTVATLTKP